MQKAGRQTAEHVRRVSSELTRSLRQDGLLGGTVAAPVPRPSGGGRADFSGVADKVKTRVLGQDAFVSAVVKAFRRPFVLGTAADAGHAKNLMLLSGPDGTGRHYTLSCVVEELAARGILRSPSVETMDLSLYPGPAQEKLFLQDLYAALQSDAEVLAFDHYEGCAASYRNMVATLAMHARWRSPAGTCCSGASWWTWAPPWPPAPSGSCRLAVNTLCFSPPGARMPWRKPSAPALWTPSPGISAAPSPSPRRRWQRWQPGVSTSWPSGCAVSAAWP